MNERILKLALDAGLLNYVDNETPRHYFVHGHADLEEVEKFAESLIRECIGLCLYAGEDVENGNIFYNPTNENLKLLIDCNFTHLGPVAWYAADTIKTHFGVAE